MRDSVIVWGAAGRLLNQFESQQEAEEWIKECEYEVMATTYNKGDTNIVVMDLD